MSDSLCPRGCTQLHSGAAGEGRAWKWEGWRRAEAKSQPWGGGLLAGLGELVDWEPMTGLEDASGGSGSLAEGEQDKKEGAELWGPAGSDCGHSSNI